MGKLIDVYNGFGEKYGERRVQLVIGFVVVVGFIALAYIGVDGQPGDNLNE